MMFMAFDSEEVLAQSPYTGFFIELDLMFNTPYAGELVFFMGNDEREDLNLNMTSRPELTGFEDPNLIKAFDHLIGSDPDDLELFKRVLEGKKEPVLDRMNVRYHHAGGKIGISIRSNFTFNHTLGRAEYRYLAFLDPFRLPAVKRNDPESLANYDSVIKQFSRIEIKITVHPPAGANLDFQWDGAYHWRTRSNEGLSFRSDLVGFITNGHKFTISDEGLLSTGSMFYFSIASTIAGAMLTGIACFRKRFKRWALIFPAGAFLILPGPTLFFLRPYLNPYGLYDAGLIMMSAVFIGYTMAINFAPRGEKVEEGPIAVDRENIRHFKMPKVIYVDRPVYLKGRGGPPEGNENDPYDVLGVPPSSSMREIEVAYREKVLKYHPDKVHNSPDWVEEVAQNRIKDLNGAFEEIKKRRETIIYDR